MVEQVSIQTISVGVIMTDLVGGIDVHALTPVEKYDDIWIKRDDKFVISDIGVCGGKSRACWVLAQGAKGLCTGSARLSPQQQIVSRIAKKLGIPCRIHTANGEYTAEMKDAVKWGAEIIQHRNGFSQNLATWAAMDAKQLGHRWVSIPFGMESREAIACARNQTRNLPKDAKRLVVILGSGIAASSIMWGLRDLKFDIQVIGVRVGGGDYGRNVERRLEKYAPPDWRRTLKIVQALVPYTESVEAEVHCIQCDSHYEAKAVPFIQPGDCFWIVGKRPAIEV